MRNLEVVLFEEREEFVEVYVGVIFHNDMFDLLEICLCGVEKDIFFGPFDV